jgi:hypothetical protein
MLSSASHIASSQVIFPEVRVFDGYLSTQTGTFVAARGISQLHLSYCVSFVYVFFFARATSSLNLSIEFVSGRTDWLVFCHLAS